MRESSRICHPAQRSLDPEVWDGCWARIGTGSRIFAGRTGAATARRGAREEEGRGWRQSPAAADSLPLRAPVRATDGSTLVTTGGPVAATVETTTTEATKTTRPPAPAKSKEEPTGRASEGED